MLSEEVKNKNDKLLDVQKELKKRFVGIDDVIDQFIDSIRVWYVMPELMTRPLIVNLWGLTGSGKTDLIRTFVSLSGMSQRFIEMQMDMENRRSIREVMEYSDVDVNSPYILLLDEFQRFRTKDKDGKDIKHGALQDIWMLLSDGKFQSASDKKRILLDILLSDLYYSHNEELNPSDDEKDKKKEKEFKYKQSYYDARYLKKMLKIPNDIKEIMTWDFDTKQKLIMKSLESDEVFDGSVYSKLLIVIAGNLDEAYDMSKSVANADVDADVFHEHSKHINIVTIKKALFKRFKPEQISRLGNNHIIYTALNKDSYYRIINANVSKILTKIEDLHKIKIIPDQSVYDTIYSNGVFPTQGVRPVISTISNIFENYLPNFLFAAIEKEINVIHLKYDQNNLIGIIGSKVLSYKANLKIDEIKKKASEHTRALVSVHEAGHALVYGILNKTSPTQIISNTSDPFTQGFIGTHSSQDSKKKSKQAITTLLAGQAAEEIVFGDDFKSNGASTDISYATNIGASYVRHFGFDGFQSKIVGLRSTDNSDMCCTNIEETNYIIETLLKEQKLEALKIINENKGLFKAIVDKLVFYGKISPDDFAKLFKEHGLEISVVSSDKKLIDEYSKKWEEFKNK